MIPAAAGAPTGAPAAGSRASVPATVGTRLGAQGNHPGRKIAYRETVLRGRTALGSEAPPARHSSIAILTPMACQRWPGIR
jgi:hypothetical protein